MKHLRKFNENARQITEHLYDLPRIVGKVNIDNFIEDLSNLKRSEKTNLSVSEASPNEYRFSAKLSIIQ